MDGVYENFLQHQPTKEEEETKVNKIENLHLQRKRLAFAATHEKIVYELHRNNSPFLKIKAILLPSQQT